MFTAALYRPHQYFVAAILRQAGILIPQPARIAILVKKDCLQAHFIVRAIAVLAGTQQLGNSL